MAVAQSKKFGPSVWSLLAVDLQVNWNGRLPGSPKFGRNWPESRVLFLANLFFFIRYCYMFPRIKTSRPNRPFIVCIMVQNLSRLFKWPAKAFCLLPSEPVTFMTGITDLPIHGVQGCALADLFITRRAYSICSLLKPTVEAVSDNFFHGLAFRKEHGPCPGGH